MIANDLTISIMSVTVIGLLITTIAIVLYLNKERK